MSRRRRPRPPPPRPLVVFLWDAGSAVLARRFLDEGVLPNLARLAARGVRAGARPAFPCAQTPPGTATVLTGAPASVHGIHGYREAARPRDEHHALASESGFDARRLAAEPLWSTVSRVGRHAVVHCVPLCHPFGPFERGGRHGPPSGSKGSVLAIDGYSAHLAGQSVARVSQLEARAPPPPPPRAGAVEDARGALWPFALQPWGDRKEPEERAIAVGVGRSGGSQRAWARLAGTDGPSVELAPGAAASIHLAPALGVSLLALELDAKENDALLWRGGTWRVAASGGRGEVAAAIVAGAGAFCGNGAAVLYREGLLGPSCRLGGDGAAERRFAATLSASSRTFGRAGVHLLGRHRADAFFLYEQCIDETAHLFQDLAEDALAGSGAAASRCGLETLRAAYVLADEHLGAVVAAAPRDAVVAVVSDHGQQAVRRVLRPNVLLERAGLVVLDETTGRIALEKTQAVFGLAGNGWVIVNDAGRPHGVVPPERRAEVLARAREVLAAARDDSGRPLVAAIHDQGAKTPLGELPGREAGDLFVSAEPDVALVSSTAGPAVEPGHGGHHTSCHDVPELDALLVIGGDGLPAGTDLGRVSNEDVAPTLAKLVGLPRPRDARGRELV